MPGFNGQGPQGQGPRTGRGAGRCNSQTSPDAPVAGRGRGCGLGRGPGPGQGMGPGQALRRGRGAALRGRPNNLEQDGE
ncbi:DUF5320 domain-containing protein [Geoalkalibacter subterraneus]|uniref:DUF5320 domain-containing protein n=1 Tax=Geoalkalibacter subterraneus TaxID=483547 RepID=UPI000A046CB6|nr:DUF5320 domain-containing protein [Geoalkalibacter subterraneus]